MLLTLILGSQKILFTGELFSKKIIKTNLGHNGSTVLNIIRFKKCSTLWVIVAICIIFPTFFNAVQSMTYMRRRKVYLPLPLQNTCYLPKKSKQFYLIYFTFIYNTFFKYSNFKYMYM